MPGAAVAQTDRAFDVLIDLDRRWRAGDDQRVWPRAEVELRELRTAFDRLVASDRALDAQRFAVCAFGPMTMHFDAHTASSWAHAALDLASDTVGRWTASACAIAAWGDMARGQLDAAAVLLRRGMAALDNGAVDDGLLPAAALHLIVFGGEPVVSEDRLAAIVSDALGSDDLHRQVWVCSYTGRVDDALAAAAQLDSHVLNALALSAAAMAAPTDVAVAESWWSVACNSHSFLLRNNAARHISALNLRGDAPLAGMQLLERTGADWLHRDDTRVWDVLWSMAVGFRILGDDDTAAALRSAVGDRAVGTVSSDEHRALEHCGSTGAVLGAAGALALASDRLARLEGENDHVAGSKGSLTPRQRQVANLIARGLSNKEIAAVLGISRLTAETHVRNILARMGAPSRAAVAAVFARSGAE